MKNDVNEKLVKNFPNDEFYYSFIKLLKELMEVSDNLTYKPKGDFFEQSVALIRRDEAKIQINRILAKLQELHEQAIRGQE